MKNILITGCGSGLGKILSENKYHNIFSHYRFVENPPVNSIVGDLRDINVLNSLSQIIDDNDINVFINNVGVYLNSPISEISDEELIEVINVNLISSMLLLKRIYSYFKKKNGGLIININSLAGKTPAANESVYCASKFGLCGFSKSIQLEAIGTGIRIVDLYPGAIKTRMTKDRQNYDNLIDPNDIAALIYGIIENEKTCYQNEIILRKN
jgi:short-subunit dehydrogenase